MCLPPLPTDDQISCVVSKASNFFLECSSVDNIDYVNVRNSQYIPNNAARKLKAID